MIRLFTYSLTLRLLGIFLLLAALLAAGTVAGIRWIYSADDLRSLVSGHLALHVDYVRRDIGSPPRIDRALAITRRVPADIYIEGPGMRWSSDPAFPDPATLQFGPSAYFSDRPGALVDRLEGVDFASKDDHKYLRFNEGGYWIVVVTPKIATRRDRPQLLPILVGYALLLVLGAYLAVRWLFKPLASIRKGAAFIGAGHFGHRIDTQRDDELGALAMDINSMAGRVASMLDAERQLLLGVSHELRSPLSRINLNLSLLEESPSTQSLRRDVDEMREIVETILQAERLGSRQTALELRPVIIQDMVHALRSRFFPAEPRLQVRIAGASTAELDQNRILLMLKNLVGNALRYSAPEDGPVELAVSADALGIEFRVRDYGPGIDAEQRAHLGEPFYRSDKSRTRQTGGAGLGLYLARQVARAHGGDLSVADCEGPGALLVVFIPRSFPAKGA